MSIKRVTELDLGEGLEIQGDKVTVKTDGVTITVDNGVLKAKIPTPEAIIGDRFLADATYDENAKELVLITRKEGEDDKEFRVPISHIFQVEVEELFTKEDGVESNFGFYHNDINNGNNISATGVGKIKGTDWYVFKFNQAEMDDFKTKLDAEKAKRPFALTDVNTSNFGISEFSFGNKSYLYLPASVINIDNQDVIKANTLPTALGYKINGQEVKELYFTKNDETGVVSYPVRSETADYTRYDGFVYPIELEDGDEAVVEIFVRQGNTHNGETVKSFTYYGGQDYIDAPEFMLKSWTNSQDGIYRTNIKSLYSYRKVDNSTVEVQAVASPILFTDIKVFKQDTLPTEFLLSVEEQAGDAKLVGTYLPHVENGKIVDYRFSGTPTAMQFTLENSMNWNMVISAKKPNGETVVVYGQEFQDEYKQL